MYNCGFSTTVHLNSHILCPCMHIYCYWVTWLASDLFFSCSLASLTAKSIYSILSILLCLLNRFGGLLVIQILYVNVFFKPNKQVNDVHAGATGAVLRDYQGNSLQQLFCTSLNSHVCVMVTCYRLDQNQGRPLPGKAS